MNPATDTPTEAIVHLSIPPAAAGPGEDRLVSSAVPVLGHVPLRLLTDGDIARRTGDRRAGEATCVRSAFGSFIAPDEFP